jgi:hypothetical protein
VTEDPKREFDVLRARVDALQIRHEVLERRTGELANIALRNEDASQRALRRVDELAHEQRGMVAGIEGIIRRQVDAAVKDIGHRFEGLERTTAELEGTIRMMLERQSAGQAAAKEREDARVASEQRDRERLVEIEQQRAHALERLKVRVPIIVALVVAVQTVIVAAIAVLKP